MPRCVVISQPMVFPWSGLFEQVRAADVFVHFDDVQFPQGRSFTSRVQVKTAQGVQWLTVPVRRGETTIRDVRIDEQTDWRARHLRTLEQAHARAPHRDAMLGLVHRVLERRHERLADLNIDAIEAMAGFLGLSPRFARSSDTPVEGKGTTRLLALLELHGATRYVTGHGARNYLDHDLLESRGIAVEYMQYACRPYDQPHGPFTPYVTMLDAIAWLGPAASGLLESRTLSWREFLEHAC